MKGLTILLLILVTAWAAGCSDSSSGEFREFTPVETDRPDEHVPELESEPESGVASRVAASPDEEPLEPEFAADSDDTQQVAIVTGSAPPLNGVLEPSITPPVPGQPALANETPAEPREIKLLVKEKKFKAEGPDGALRVSYDDLDLLKILNMEPVPVDAADHFPTWLKDLDGKRIRIRGFMYPPFQETEIPFFVLARDNQICCFGRNPTAGFNDAGARKQPIGIGPA